VSSAGDGAVVGAALVCSSAVAVVSPVGVEHPDTVVASATKRTIEEVVITGLARLVSNGDAKLIVKPTSPAIPIRRLMNANGSQHPEENIEACPVGATGTLMLWIRIT
jgi:hypothetical protein